MFFLQTNGSGVLSFSSVSTEVKVWVNFDGTGTPSARGYKNVSSITDNGTGNYTVNFTTALADANYSFVFGGAGTNYFSNSYSTSSITIVSYNLAGTAVSDVTEVCLAIFR